jgi:hypothetical protein
MYTDTILRHTLPVARGFLAIQWVIVAFTHLQLTGRSRLKVAVRFVM